MKTMLICHDGAEFDYIILAHWLASFSDLVGVIIIREPVGRVWRRMRREFKRGGILHFLDVLLFRAYYRASRAAADRRWMRKQLERLPNESKNNESTVEVLSTSSPNSSEAKAFIERLHPDMVLARCKSLLKEEVFSIPSLGTFVMHPGICPEYRNAHGCFWALVNRDLERVGMTLLRVDSGVDTGPIFGYYSYPFDESRESHIVIQYRVVLENLDALRDKFLEIQAGTATPLSVEGRHSATWGQPRFTQLIRWKYLAHRSAP